MPRLRYLPIILVGLLLFSSVFVYQALPDQVPAHWNFKGEVDRYGSRLEGAFAVPVATALLYALLSVVLRRQENAAPQESRTRVMLTVAFFKTSEVLLFASLYAYTVFTALGKRASINSFMAVPLALAFYCVGALVKDTPRNTLSGVRMPWTLASDEVWARTQSDASTLYKATAPIQLLSLVWPRFFFAWLSVPVVVLPVWLVFKSWRYSRSSR